MWSALRNFYISTWNPIQYPIQSCPLNHNLYHLTYLIFLYCYISTWNPIQYPIQYPIQSCLLNHNIYHLTYPISVIVISANKTQSNIKSNPVLWIITTTYTIQSNIQYSIQYQIKSWLVENWGGEEWRTKVWNLIS